MNKEQLIEKLKEALAEFTKVRYDQDKVEKLKESVCNKVIGVLAPAHLDGHLPKMVERVDLIVSNGRGVIFIDGVGMLQWVDAAFNSPEKEREDYQGCDQEVS